jgi:hypothetical protein
MGIYQFQNGAGQTIFFAFRVAVIGGFQPFWSFTDEAKNDICLMYKNNDSAGIGNFSAAVSEAFLNEQLVINDKTFADAWAARETSKEEFFSTCQFGFDFNKSTQFTFLDSRGGGNSSATAIFLNGSGSTLGTVNFDISTGVDALTLGDVDTNIDIHANDDPELTEINAEKANDVISDDNVNVTIDLGR